MLSQSLARISVKLLGLYLYVASAIAFFELLAMMPIYSGDKPHELAWVYILSSFACICVSAAAATLLIKRTDWVVKIGFSPEDEEITGESLNEKALMAIGISMVGLVFVMIGLCSILTLVVQWLGVIPSVVNGNPGDFLVFRGKELVLALAQVGLGLCVFVGHKTVHGLWKKAVSLWPGEAEQRD